MVMPSKFTGETRYKLIAAIRGGNRYETACRFVNIDLSTFKTWMKKGEKASYDNPVNLSDDDLDFLAFYEAVNEAEAQAEMTAVLRWREGMDHDWKAARDFLGRRWQKNWGPKVDITVHEIDDQILELLGIEDSSEDREIEDAEIVPDVLPQLEQQTDDLVLIVDDDIPFLDDDDDKSGLE